MMKKAFLAALALLPGLCLSAQTSFVVLGDVHQDKFDFHDMDYVYSRPSDWKQITREYPYQTAAYMPKLWAAVSRRVSEGCSAVCQLGDLMEGVSGSQALAEDMCRWAVAQIDEAAGDATVILTKGNHDVSNSPGQPEAWKKVVLPYVEKEVGQSLSNSMYRYSPGKDVDLFVAEQFFSNDEMLPEQALLDFLKKELPESKARYRFLLTHQPVIPVTQRCWHLFSGIRRPVEDMSVRDEFLELLAKYRVTVLCAHLHEYSYAVRKTPKGNVVQIMLISTVDSYETSAYHSKRREYVTRETMDPEWQPHTQKVREGLIASEYPFILYYTRSHTPGYAVVRTSKSGAELSFYRGFSDEVSETVSIDDLYAIR